MLNKKLYANGQPTHKIENGILTYYFKSGKTKAFGGYIEEQMQGEWIFFKESQGDGDQLWQVGHFLDNEKHGNWRRVDKDGVAEYEEDFAHGKKL